MLVARIKEAKIAKTCSMNALNIEHTLYQFVGSQRLFFAFLSIRIIL